MIDCCALLLQEALDIHITGGGHNDNLRTCREVLPVADNLMLLHTEVPFIDYNVLSILLFYNQGSFFPRNRGKILTPVYSKNVVCYRKYFPAGM